jgi:FAD/FMN-containing dehydrogenase
MSTAGLLSWGRYPCFPQVPTPCHWRKELQQELSAAQRQHGTTLGYGAGSSYGDSCLAASDHVLLMRPLDRFLGADWDAGVLSAEAGVTLEEILAVAIPHGWFLPVTPGTKYITLGGAIANDVHGKNHHRRGTFGRHVRRFGLLRSDAGRVTCSPQERTELFKATIGGLGLTGLIEWAEIQLVPIRSSRIDSVRQRFGNLDEFYALSAELDEKHEFCVSWVDCFAKGETTGRGVCMAADFAGDGPLVVETSRKLTVPFTPPFSLVNRLSLRAFNEMYWRKAPTTGQLATIGYDSFFYPLDAILKWNRIYGPHGFQQYQALIPEHEAGAGIQALLAAVAESGSGSFLAVIKRCGDVPSPGLLSFPQPGTTLALDFPHTEHLVTTLFPRLDAIVRETGGRLYPAKDGHMSGADFRSSYPAWQQIEAIRDPALLSRFWKRVTQ